MEPLRPGEIRVSNVHRSYRVLQDQTPTLKATLVRRERPRAREHVALRGVDLTISAGEAVGIIGANGSGKSTLLKLIAGIIPPDSGSVAVGGSIAAMLELGAGFHPDFSGRENVHMNASIHGLSRAEVDERMDEIVAFAELADFIDAPIRTYSSGMQMRLAFAVSSHVNPDVLLLDEVLAVGDEAFQRKCLARIFSFRRAGGTLVFVSHDPAAVERVCDRAILLDGGLVAEDGDPAKVLTGYHRRLTQAEGDESAPATPVGGDDGAALGRGDDRSWGSGDVIITSAGLRGPHGPADRFLGGEPMTIEMTVLPRQPVETPLFGIGIETVEGMQCYGTNTRLDSLEVGLIDRPRVVRFMIPSLPLHEGSFLVRLAVVSHDESVVFHWLDRWLEFTVFARGTGVGPIDLSGSWSVAAENTPLAADSAS